MYVYFHYNCCFIYILWDKQSKTEWIRTRIFVYDPKISIFVIVWDMVYCRIKQSKKLGVYANSRPHHIPILLQWRAERMNCFWWFLESFSLEKFKWAQTILESEHFYINQSALKISTPKKILLFTKLMLRQNLQGEIKIWW